MKKLILIVCLSSIFGGCAILSPWKAPTSCSDTTNNGAACASVESNLEYSVKKESPITEVVQQDPYVAVVAEFENDQHVSTSTPTAPNGENLKTTSTENVYSEDSVIKDELGRLFIEMAIDSSVTKKPTFIPPATYRVLIYPYSIGSKFYSSRYVYITAGKPRWVTGSIVSDGAKVIKVSVPEAQAKKPNVKQIIENMTLKKTALVNPTPTKEAVISVEKSVKHRVASYLLNCRDIPSIEGISIAVFEQDRVLDITDKSELWWKVSFYEMECYVNSNYLYAEPEQ